MQRRSRIGIILGLLCAVIIHAAIFAVVRGVVHDPSHRPVAGVKITLSSTQSQWSRETTTNDNGEFTIDAVPAGTYSLRVEREGFTPISQSLVIASDTAPILHLAMDLTGMTQAVEVTAPALDVDPESSSAQSEVSQKQISETPGAERTNSLAMITDRVPGSYVVHNLF